MNLAQIVHCILVPREYTEVNGVLFVREWFGKPVDVVEHMRRDHGMSESEINDLLLESRKVLRREKGR